MPTCHHCHPKWLAPQVSGPTLLKYLAQKPQQAPIENSPQAAFEGGGIHDALQRCIGIAEVPTIPQFESSHFTRAAIRCPKALRCIVSGRRNVPAATQVADR